MERGKKSRWAVVGCGQIARDKTIPAIAASERAVLTALCDLRQEVVEPLGRSLGVRWFTRVEDLVSRSDFDCAYVATPTHHHIAPLSALARAKKHVLCEKPVGTTAAEVMAARDAADRNGVVVLPAYMSRFGSAFGAAREHLLKGALGQLLEISAHFSYDAGSAYPHGSDGAWRWSPEAGGGPLHDIGIYLLFAIREITGQRIATVSFAEANVRRYKKDRPDSIYGWFATENGVPGVMTTTFSHSDMFVRFVGTSGTATLSGAFSQTAAGVLEMETDDLSLRLGSTTAAQRQFDNYRKQVDDFVAVTLGQKSSDISLLDAVEDALVIDAILSSVRMGRACPIDYAVVDKFRA